jgi:thiol-disulfide isomerase/thioredoxin
MRLTACLRRLAVARVALVVVAAAAVLLGLAAAPASAQEGGVTAERVMVERVTHKDVFDAIAARGARVTVVNFWATWCVPCIEEFPSFTRLGDAYADRDVEVMFVSADFPDEEAAVRAFLAEQGVTGTSFLKDEKTTPFVNAFHEDWSGALPATFIYDAEGALVTFWEGKTTYADLEREVTTVLD